jgi:anti-sigma regulatory factor (Ser/Thr protein kinase)
MARPTRSLEIEDSLLDAAPRHPNDLVGVVAERLGLSNARVSTEVRSLVEQGYLEKSGTTRPTYSLGKNRRLHRTYPRAAITEDDVWNDSLDPLLRGLPRNVIDIAHYGVTEMVNNAIDHSAARHVLVDADLRDGILRVSIDDDGVGIFRKIAGALRLADERQALLELSKGKFTTDPRNHSGEGVFFTSRTFDQFQIVSGGLIFDHDEEESDDVLFDMDDLSGKGTNVHMAIAVSSTRTLNAVFSAYSSGPDEYAFAKTVVPVRLAQVGDQNLVSRSQAKRVLQRVEKFRHVVLDFDRIGSIGQGFADEIFRVFANAHPDIELMATNAVPEVRQMIRRAEAARKNQ